MTKHTKISSVVAAVLLVAGGGCDLDIPEIKYDACGPGGCDSGVQLDAAAHDLGAEVGAPDASADQAAPDSASPDLAPPPKPWALALGGASADRSNAVAVGPAGDVHLAGAFSGSLNVGGQTLTGQAEDALVVKLSSTGGALWATGAGGTGDDAARSIAVDAAGDVYVCGQYKGSAKFGSLTLSGGKYGDGFVAKLDGKTGAFVWVVKLGASTLGAAHGLALDAKGAPHVTGYFYGGANLGGKVLSSKARDVFVAKLDPATGKPAWFVQAGGALDDLGHAIAVDSKGYSYITGEYAKAASFGAKKLWTGSLRDLFIAKLNPSGKFDWAFGSAIASVCVGTAVAVDSKNQAYVTGYFRKSTQLGKVKLVTKAEHDLFVTRIDVAGNFIWAAQGGAKGCGTGCYAQGQGITVDKSGQAYVAGWFSGGVSPAGAALTAKGKDDLLVARVNSVGKLDWATSAGSAAHDRARGLALAPKGQLVLTGDLGGALTLAGSALVSGGSSDLLVWQFTPGL